MTQTLFAMAGFAEGAVFFGIMVVFAFSLLQGFLALICLATRWFPVGVLSLFVTLVLATCLQPWDAFTPVESDDPDFLHLISLERVAVVMWLVAATGTIASAIFAMCGSEHGELDAAGLENNQPP